MEAKLLRAAPIPTRFNKSSKPSCLFPQQIRKNCSFVFRINSNLSSNRGVQSVQASAVSIGEEDEIEVVDLWQTVGMFISTTPQIMGGLSLKSLVDKLLPLMIVCKRNCHLDRERAIFAARGQALCTTAAVLGGKGLASQISEKFVAFSGGVLFIIFGIHSFLSYVE